MTDEAGQYTHLYNDFANHEYVNHGAGEYGRGTVHTNTLEGYYSIFRARYDRASINIAASIILHRYVASSISVIRTASNLALMMGHVPSWR